MLSGCYDRSMTEISNSTIIQQWNECASLTYFNFNRIQTKHQQLYACLLWCIQISWMHIAPEYQGLYNLIVNTRFAFHAPHVVISHFERCRDDWDGIERPQINGFRSKMQTMPTYWQQIYFDRISIVQLYMILMLYVTPKSRQFMLFHS